MNVHGGPAFPVPGVNSGHGMTLRDWFAGQAINGFLTHVSPFDDEPEPETIETVVANAYRYADAMLEFRRLN